MEGRGVKHPGVKIGRPTRGTRRACLSVYLSVSEYAEGWKLGM